MAKLHRFFNYDYDNDYDNDHDNDHDNDNDNDWDAEGIPQVFLVNRP